MRKLKKKLTHSNRTKMAYKWEANNRQCFMHEDIQAIPIKK